MPTCHQSEKTPVRADHSQTAKEIPYTSRDHISHVYTESDLGCWYCIYLPSALNHCNCLSPRRRRLCLFLFVLSGDSSMTSEQVVCRATVCAMYDYVYDMQLVLMLEPASNILGSAASAPGSNCCFCKCVKPWSCWEFKWSSDLLWYLWQEQILKM